jgi:hypothetical protein
VLWIHIWPHTLITTMNYLCDISTINNVPFYLDSSWYQPLTPLKNREEGGYLSITGSNNTVKIFSTPSRTHIVSLAITPFTMLQSPWTVAFSSRLKYYYIYIFFRGTGVIRHKNKSTDLIIAQRLSRSVCSTA